MTRCISPLARWGLCPPILVALATCLGTCARVAPPVVDAVRQSAAATPVVFVPGVTGVGLVDSASGKSVWGQGSDLLGPFDRGYATARPIVAGSPQRVAAGEVILQLRLLGLVRKRVYSSLVELFAANNYRLGDLAAPRPEESFFLFAYDWRQDNVDSARLLWRRLERLQRVRGDDQLRIVLICQSNGAHICRYAARYGGLALEEAESGGRAPQDAVRVEKLVLLGSSNGGSLRVLRELNRGRRYVPLVGRYWAPETLFTYLSLYQDLPVYTTDLFVDLLGDPVAVDLFDADNWQRYGWSVWGRRSHQRLTKGKRGDLFGDSGARHEFLSETLDRARRFHHLLLRDAGTLGATRYYLIKNTHSQTIARAVLAESERGWRTLFPGDEPVDRDPLLAARTMSPGDGHATAESQMWLSAEELARLAWEPIDVEGRHFEVIFNPATREHLLEILAGEQEGGRSVASGH